MNKKAQSEMAGFGIIVIIISIIILVFISFSLNKNPNNQPQNYESEAFVQSYLQFTTQCEKNSHYLSSLELIKLCKSGVSCDDGESSCKVLNETSKGILESSWKVGEYFPVKGYDFSIIYQGENLIQIFEGNKTSENRGSMQTFSGDLDVSFISYY
ncbi:hypothetical protein CO153_01765 [Candidatus Pacearchaeota archaeon CG_4_9_14_3_um_filter_30_11]|nr:MAG: hypothetical protein CO153_01765 [Candidatus Pacearchaeota archaeon CG_4_9_14_3_um_filter_30_11]